MSIESVQILFEKQAAQNPNHIALQYEDQALTYAELNRRANQLAHYLLAKKVVPEQLIGVCIERSFDLFIAILGILKAGAAYVPFEPRHPAKRLQWMRNDAKIEIVITQSHLLSIWKDEPCEKIRIDVDCDDIDEYPTGNPNIPVSAHHLAYVIYTSGSTGQPKGVCIEHGSLMNLVAQHVDLFEVNTESNILQFSSIGFDASVLEWTLALTKGGTLSLLTSSLNKSLTDSFFEICHIYKITIAFLTPAFAELISYESLPYLKVLGIGGDRCTEKVISKWHSKVKVVNAYGPTEVTVFSLAFVCNNRYPAATIGKPINNTNVYLLDDTLKLAYQGEIYIGGMCLARGYLNHPELTNHFFIPNPFKPGERLYKTGDLGRFLPDGSIEFTGRKDEQIKINGHRVELQEISAVISKIEGVKENVVLFDANNGKLVACVAFEKKWPKTSDIYLSTQLHNLLPAYMIPKTILSLEKLPLNHNGKYDKEYLYSLFQSKEGKNKKSQNTEQLGSVLVKLLQIGRDVLRYPALNIHDDLLNLGMDSIIALQFAARAQQNGIFLGTQDIFKEKTLHRLSQKKYPDKKDDPTLWKTRSYQLFSLSPIQAWFFEQDFANPNHWNQSAAIEIRDTTVNLEALNQAWNSLHQFHDSLRLYFQKKESGWMQAYQTIGIHPDFITCVPINDIHQISTYTDSLQKKMDIQRGRLSQAILFRIATTGQHLLFVIFHHLAIDGISWRILLEDLAKLYEKHARQKPLTLHRSAPYQQWIKVLKQYSKSAELLQEIPYWQNILAEQSSILCKKPASHSKTIKTVEHLSFELNADETDILLHQSYQAYDARVEEILLTALLQMFHQETEQKKLSLMIDRHGRETDDVSCVDVSRTVGWFTTLSPVNIFYTTPHLENLITSIKSQLKSTPNKGLGYSILRYLKSRSNDVLFGNEPSFNFNYMGQWIPSISEALDWHFGGLIEKNDIGLENHFPHDIEIIVFIINEKLKIKFSYQTSLYTTEMMQRWGIQYLACIKNIVLQCKSKLSEPIEKLDNYEGI